LTDGDRALIQEEVTQLKEEINRFSGTVEFNGQPLLNGDFAAGTGDFNLHVGANQNETANVNIEAMSTTALGIDNIDVSTRAGAESSIGALDTALTRISEQRANIGATENRLQSTFNFTRIEGEAMTASESRIRDADMALEMLAFTKTQILQNSGMAMLSQANMNSQSIMSLLG